MNMSSVQHTAEHSFCPIPWTSLNITNSGTITPCCLGSEDLFADINIKDKDRNLNDTLNSEKFSLLRNSLLKNEKPSFCQACWKSEMNGRKSHRQQFLEYYSEYNKTWAEYNTQKNGTMNSPFIKRFDLRLGKKCNLKCLMCNPNQSSLWAEQLHLNKYISKDWNQSSFCWEAILNSIIDTLKQDIHVDLFLAGGEPFLDVQHINILQQLIDKNLSSKVSLIYTSNLTVLPERLVCLWKHYKTVVVLASIDGFGALCEYIRFPLKWNVVEKNLNKLLGMDEVLVVIQPCVSIYNVYSMGDFFIWAEALRQKYLGKEIEVELNPHLVYNPSELYIGNLGKVHIEYLENKLLQDEKNIKNIEFLRSLLFQCKSSDSKNSLSSFWKYTNSQEEIRGNSFSLVASDWSHQLKMRDVGIHESK